MRSDIKYVDKNNQLQSVYETSWGWSTRSIGALIMVHGDDRRSGAYRRMWLLVECRDDPDRSAQGRRAGQSLSHCWLNLRRPDTE